ncbi:MAG: hypothetical protein EOP88_13545 [Verrucomicrobiaceae bacterium]|nr:MAG: hypothetical protein EOP88_13545 [Verrucomicrobiaceae bacterium]
MELDRSQIDWKRTATLVRASLAEQRQNIVWLSTEIAKKLGTSDSSRSELYAFTKEKAFKLSDRKLLAIFDILKIEPVRIGQVLASIPPGEMMLGYCSKADCRCAEWTLSGYNNWTSVPAPQWLSSADEKHCGFCGGKSLISECQECGHPLKEGSHCRKCGAPYAPIDEKTLDKLLDKAASTNDEAELSLIKRKAGHVLGA